MVELLDRMPHEWLTTFEDMEAWEITEPSDRDSADHESQW